MFKGILVSLVTIGLVACGGGDGDGDGSGDGGTNPENDGVYNVSASSTTDFDKDGGACAASASGELSITEGNITGNVVDSFGTAFSLSGSVTSDGSFSAGVASDGENLVEFIGQLSGNSGSGTYSDIYECEGNWTLELISSEIPTSSEITPADGYMAFNYMDAICTQYDISDWTQEDVDSWTANSEGGTWSAGQCRESSDYVGRCENTFLDINLVIFLTDFDGFDRSVSFADCTEAGGIWTDL